jgi:predicted NAD/FAD-binding protein
MVRAAEGTQLPQGRCRVAVIGLGMAGATTAHLLAQKHDVVGIEALPQAGLHYHSIADGDISFDVPLRAMSPHYYPNLFRMYQVLGVDLAPVNYQSTGSDGDSKDPYFSYSNAIIAGHALPFPRLRSATLWQTINIVFNYLWLVFSSTFLMWNDRDGALYRETMGNYLVRNRYSGTFVDRFFLPVMSTLLSCSYEQVLHYPAALILEFFCARKTTLFTGWFRLKSGVRAVSQKLLEGIECRYDTKVTRIERVWTGAKVTSVRLYFDGVQRYEAFDYVVLATDAPVAAKMLHDASADESVLLNSVGSFHARIIAHTDDSFMPTDKRSWSGLNYFSVERDPLAARSKALEKPAAPHDASMTTAFMNRFGMSGALTGEAAAFAMEQEALARPGTPEDVQTTVTSLMFQTWNPHHAPRKEAIIRESYMGRAVWSVEGLAAFQAACARGVQGRGRVWFAGSYASRGVTLLEQACTSGLDVAADFGVDLPFQITREPTYNWLMTLVGAVLMLLAWIASIPRRLANAPRI